MNPMKIMYWNCAFNTTDSNVTIAMVLTIRIQQEINARTLNFMAALLQSLSVILF